MLSATIERKVIEPNNFVSEEKGKLLKACSDMVILIEIRKRGILSALDIITLFKTKYDIQISPGTVYPILCRMEKKRYIRLLPNRKKKVYALADLGQKALLELQLSITDIQDFVTSLFIK